MSEEVFMRMIVLFDLPVTTKAKMRTANQFRQFLLKDGYQMLQLSIYTRIIKGRDALEKHHKRLVAHLPEEGSIRCLSITEKQFASMEILVGEKKPQEKKSIQINYCFFNRFFRQKKAPKPYGMGLFAVPIIALRNKKGSYNVLAVGSRLRRIIALRNKKGSYNLNYLKQKDYTIIALRNKKGNNKPKNCLFCQ